MPACDFTIVTSADGCVAASSDAVLLFRFGSAVGLVTDAVLVIDSAADEVTVAVIVIDGNVPPLASVAGAPA